MNLHAVVATENAASSSGPTDPETIKAIYEIALRNYEQLEKAYDTMNTRVGVVFGFSGIITASFYRMLESIPAAYSTPKAIAGLIFALSSAALAWQCRKAFKANEYNALPSFLGLLRKHSEKSITDLRIQIIENLGVEEEHNRKTYQAKANHFQFAVQITFFQALCTFIVLAALSILTLLAP